jgi:hypothetical protein
MRLETRVAGCLLALAVAACGDAFTDERDTPSDLDGSFDSSLEGSSDSSLDGSSDSSLDGSSDSSLDGSSDSSLDALSDTGLPDAKGEDAAGPTDAESRDALGKEGGGQSDGSAPPPADGGLDASLCVKTCPSGFDCLAGVCVDRAAQHFGAATATDNWSYGSFMNFGSTRFIPYEAMWTIDGIVFASQTKTVLTSSVFHSLATASYEGMTLPAGTLGLYPGAMTSVDSVVRWTAPVAGQYAISATFSGLGTRPPTTVGVNVNLGPQVTFSPTLDGTTNSTTYTNAGQSMAAGDTIDFYVDFTTLSEDEQGGTGLDARITAN